MRILDENKLDGYVEDCLDEINFQMEMFKMEKFNDTCYTNDVIIERETKGFDFLFPFKYLRITEYSSRHYDKGYIDNSMDEIFFLEICTKYMRHMRDILDTIEPPLVYVENDKFDYNIIGFGANSDIVDRYALSKLIQLERKANFEWDMSDKTSVEMYEQIFLFIYIMESLTPLCNSFEVEYWLADSKASLLRKVESLENEIL